MIVFTYWARMLIEEQNVLTHMTFVERPARQIATTQHWNNDTFYNWKGRIHIQMTLYLRRIIIPIRESIIL